VNANGSGDLHVRVQLWTPQSLSDEQEQLIKQLAEAGGEPPATRSKGIWSRMKEALGA
jgi:molecular chaperone DnaJ